MENKEVVPTMSLREQMAGAQQERSIRTGFETVASFELLQREAKLLSRSEMVPEMFRDQIMVKKGPQKGTFVANPSAQANCVLALNMANRMNIDVLMLMQNLLMIQGRLSWSSQFVIAAINRSGHFSAVQFQLSKPGTEETMEYEVREWNENARRMENLKKKITFADQTCVAWAIEKATGERVESPEVSLRMAVLEGWFGKEGSKWKTMPEVMLRYRAASFFGKLYAPETMMGLPSEDEAIDMGTAGGALIEIAPVSGGRGSSTESAAGQEKPAENGSQGVVNAAPAAPAAPAEAAESVAPAAQPAVPGGQTQGAPRAINARRGQVKQSETSAQVPPVATGGAPQAAEDRDMPPAPNFDEMSDEDLLAMDSATYG